MFELKITPRKTGNVETGCEMFIPKITTSSRLAPPAESVAAAINALCSFEALVDIKRVLAEDGEKFFSTCNNIMHAVPPDDVGFPVGSGLGAWEGKLVKVGGTVGEDDGLLVGRDVEGNDVGIADGENDGAGERMRIVMSLNLGAELEVAERRAFDPTVLALR